MRPGTHIIDEWRKAVLSSLGPESPTTRYVLLALSTHMDHDGGNCQPSESRLAEETGLSKRAIITHLQAAEADGWIVRRRKRGKGRIWHFRTYEHRFPARLDGSVCRDEVKDVHLDNEPEREARAHDLIARKFHNGPVVAAGASV